MESPFVRGAKGRCVRLLCEPTPNMYHVRWENKVHSEKLKVKTEKPTHRESVDREREEIFATTSTSKKKGAEQISLQFIFLFPVMF